MADDSEDAVSEEEEEDVDDMDSEEHNVSLAAMEITLLPQLLATFEHIATTYKRLHGASTSVTGHSSE